MKGKINVKSQWIFTNYFKPLIVDFDKNEIYKKNWFFNYDPTHLKQIKNARVTTTWIDVVMLFTTYTLVIDTFNNDVPVIKHPGILKDKKLDSLLSILTDWSAKGTIKMEQG